jgi:carboxymethylenebutenolidase
MRRILLPLVAAMALTGCGAPSEPEPGAAAVPAAVQATAAQHAHDSPEPSPVVEAEPRTPVLAREVAYGEAERSNLEGFLAMPADAAEPLPGLIVIHEWWGLNDNIEAMTRRLAGEGYVALAVDLYGGAVAGTPEEAQGLMAAVVNDPDKARANLKQAYEYLEKYAFAPRIASIGWCLGGGWALETARLFPDHLDGMVMYYGQFVNDAEVLAPLQMPVLGLFGGRDKSIPTADVIAFRGKLNELGKNAKILIYPEADHAFANPSGGNYNAKAADDAWQETVAFLAANLKVPASGP